MSHRLVIITGFFLGTLALVLSLFDGASYLQWFVGLSFVYFFSGYPVSLLLLPKAKGFGERLVSSAGLSLLLTYPAGFLNVIREGQSGQAIFGRHLVGDLGFLLLFYVFSCFVVWRKGLLKATSGFTLSLRNNLPMILVLLLAVFMTFYKLEAPDLNGDEYDLGYQAYNLVDGIFAGRKAYVLSFNSHPPLPMYIQHFTFQLLSPYGIDSMRDWMFRMGPAMLGIMTVVVTYLLGKEISRSRWVGVMAAGLLAVSNYHLFVSRIFQREAFLAFYLMIAIYMFARYLTEKKERYLLLAAIFSGGAMLVKVVALIFVVPAIIFLVGRGRLKNAAWFMAVVGLIFLPVVVYNIGAYLTTGYMDIFFGQVFHTNIYPGASQVNNQPGYNLLLILRLLSDQFGFLSLLAFGVGFLMALKFRDRLVTVLLSLVTASIVLFAFVGVRAYYLSFVSVPLVIMLSLFLWRLKQWSQVLAGVLLLVIFASSMIYSAKTLFDMSFVTKENYTNAFPAIYPVRGYSLTTRNFLEDRGWKLLAARLDQIYFDGDCLKGGEGVTNLSLRRYLGTDDEVKKYYLGEGYPRKYKMCSDQGSFRRRLELYYDDSGRVQLRQI